MTVSLALRDNPKISAATRHRVRQVANRLGYRPDPEIARLMSRLRPSRRSPGGVVIAMIELRCEATLSAHPYDVGLRQGIAEHADALGLGVALFRLADYGGSLGRVLSVIRSRGITAVLLLPAGEPQTFDPRLKWDGLSVVTATTTVISPRFHQVTPNQLHNMLMLLARLEQLGRRKVVAILNAGLEERTRHYYSVALSWHGHRERILVLADDLEPEVRRTRIGAWLRQHQPDAIVTRYPDEVAAIQAKRVAPRRARPLIISLEARTDDRFPYQDQLPRLIGRTAVSVVNGLMHGHETGIPATPMVTTIDGIVRGLPAAAS